MIHPIVVVERTPDGELRRSSPTPTRPRRRPGRRRVVDPPRPGRPRPPAGLQRGRWRGCCTTSARSSRTPRRWSPGPRARRPAARRRPARRRPLRGRLDRSPARTTSRTCCAGSPTGTSRSSATATSPATAAASCTPERPGLGVLRSDSDVAADARPRAAPTTPAPTCSCSPGPAPRAACCAPCTRTTSPSAPSTPPAGSLGEHRFLGMLTVAALYESVLDIPVVERHGARRDPPRRLPAGVLLRASRCSR